MHNLALTVTPPTIANVSLYKSEDGLLTATLSPPTNIAGWALQFALRQQRGDAAALLAKTIGAGITVTDAANGVFTIALASADTAGLDPKAYAYDLQRTKAFRQALGIEPEPVVPFTTLAEIENAFQRALAAINPSEIARKTLQSRLDQLRGRI